MGGGTHLRQALQWSAEQPTDRAGVLAAGLGMAVPVLVAAWAGRLPLGMAASVGAMLMGDAVLGRDLRARAKGLAGWLAQLAIALVAAGLIAGHGGRTDIGLVVVTAIAAAVGARSRTLAVASAHFVVVVILLVGIAESAPAPLEPLCLIGLGALWRVALKLGFLSLARPAGPLGEDLLAPAARWRFPTGLAGWQYPLRLALCLGVAGIVRTHWPAHHFIWIALTVGILLRRRPEPFSLKTTQRTLGVLLGVAASGPIVAWLPPSWLLAPLIGLLGAARPWLRARNYLLYSACTTPLIILVMDVGRSVGSGILLDRLLATLVGAALVTLADLAFTAALARRS